jgi:UDP-N-acetylmuramoyl-L-alanyl-D-glutamate--2,6-diaminopimelate ligase
VEAGCAVAVMESSSQALDLRRCDALDYDVAVFTNLTQDHLDYHGTMETYFDAKRRLFDGRLGARPRISVINIDDAYGVRLARELMENGETSVSTYALRAQADVTAHAVEVTLAGCASSCGRGGGSKRSRRRSSASRTSTICLRQPPAASRSATNST